MVYVTGACFTLNQYMDITLHEEFYGRKMVSQEASDASTMHRFVPKKQTIANIMAFSRALSVNTYDHLGVQEIILN